MTTVVTEVYAIEVKIGASPRETKLSKYNENYAEVGDLKFKNLK